MPKRTDIKRVLVIGSGPIVIGQAAEFDYSGTQACKALRAEGLEVILVNSNPATIMTDPELADATYIEPLSPQRLARLRSRVVELRRQADDDRPRADHEHALDICSLRHYVSGVTENAEFRMQNADWMYRRMSGMNTQRVSASWNDRSIV